MAAAAAATGILSLCAAPALADSTADGVSANSPGVASGNTVQAPVNIPVNVCGNTVDVVAALNPAFGNSCANEGHARADVPPAPPEKHVPPKKHHPSKPPVHEEEPPGYGDVPPEPEPEHSTPATPPVISHTERPHAEPPALAETGAGGLVAASLVSAGLLTGGMVLYRRGRTAGS
jgi:hypothetical protein